MHFHYRRRHCTNLETPRAKRNNPPLTPDNNVEAMLWYRMEEGKVNHMVIFAGPN
jgi:hypothetical protein